MTWELFWDIESRRMVLSLIVGGIFACVWVVTTLVLHPRGPRRY